jgi:TonB family protein
MKKPTRKNDHLRIPEYPGGSQALQEFIAKNIRYPLEAREAGIEGDVIVAYEVTDNGLVINPHIVKGLGHGCDEEALRIIGLLRFEKVRNIRVRVRVSKRTIIHFRLPKLKFNYTVTQADKPPETKTGSPRENDQKYTYTIDIE